MPYRHPSRHPHRHIASVVMMLFALVFASACTTGQSTQPAPSNEAPADATASSEASPEATTSEATTSSEAPPEATATDETATDEAANNETTEAEFEDFDPTTFDNSTNIDNEWLPLIPGTRFVYEGTTIEDTGEAVPHRIEINVTDLTKMIGDVRAVITWDLDHSDGELVEAELAFYAQDNAGNVWRMGEYPEEYDAGEFVAAPAWLHGYEDARAGIQMLADPQVGTPSYAQGWGPAVDWTDRGQVDEIVPEVCVPLDCYEDVLVIAESSASEPDAFQLKYHARGVGLISVGWRGEGEPTKETLELVEFEQLSPEELAEVRAQALELEKSAYENSPNVYANTAPAE